MSLSYNEYKSIVETAPNLIWRSGLDAKCYYFNKTWLDFTGRSFEQEFGDGWTEGVHPDDFDRCVSIYLENFNKRTRFEMEYRLLRHDGQWRWINDIGVPAIDENGEFTGFIGSCLDVTDKVLGFMLKEMAQKDGLTDVLSRQYLMSLFELEFEAAKRTGNKLSVAMIDIDKFKNINDQYGHIGGDEFLIVFPNNSIDDARKIIERITASLQNRTINLDNDEIVISISVGLCEYTDENSHEELIKRADLKMYEDKKSKK